MATGMSAGVAPPRDISDTVAANHPQRRLFFTPHHVNSLAIVIILSATGTIGLQDTAFVVLSTLYLYLLSKFSFPSISSDPPPPVYGGNNKTLPIYVLIGAVIGLILPVIYIFTGILQGDKQGIQAAAPPLFLLACQVLMEGISFSAQFSLPIRVFVPVFYNSWRLSSILAWLCAEFSKTEEIHSKRAAAGTSLAAANMAFWSFNLLGFLLPFYLPKAFKLYYSKEKGND